MGAGDYDAVVAAPFGRLGLRLHDGALAALDILANKTALRRARTPLAKKVCAELAAYFADPHHRFKIPLAPAGTPYQLRVWRALTRIPSGAVRSYGDLAARLDSGARAVGGACRANPIPIVVPCHRVVAKSGVGGFMGARSGRALGFKLWLLKHERRR